MSTADTPSLDAWIAYCGANFQPEHNLGWMTECAKACATHADVKRFIEAYVAALPWSTVAGNINYMVNGLPEEVEGMWEAALREVGWAHGDAQ